MNLYNYHNKPAELYNHKKAYTEVPMVLWSTMSKRGNRNIIRANKHIFAKDARTAYSYAIRLRNGRFPEGEATITKDAKYSFFYAKDIIKGEFPEGEDAIATSGQYSVRYASEVLDDVFELGEDAIAKSAEYSFFYATGVIESRFKKGEAAIAKSKFKGRYKRFLDDGYIVYGREHDFE